MNGLSIDSWTQRRKKLHLQELIQARISSRRAGAKLSFFRILFRSLFTFISTCERGHNVNELISCRGCCFDVQGWLLHAHSFKTRRRVGKRKSKTRTRCGLRTRMPSPLSRTPRLAVTVAPFGKSPHRVWMAAWWCGISPRSSSTCAPSVFPETKLQSEEEIVDCAVWSQFFK